MKTEQERINALANKIRDFKVIVAGGADVAGGFGELPKKGPITMEHLLESFSKFRLTGTNGVSAHGSLEDGYVLRGDAATDEG